MESQRQAPARRALRGAIRSLSAAGSASDPELARRQLHAYRRYLQALERDWREVQRPPPGVDIVEPEQPAEGLYRLPVLERRRVDADLFVLTLPRPRAFRFQPGQHVKLGLNGRRHSYSIASAADADTLEFFIERRPGGGLSERLSRVRVGEAVIMAARASGRLRLDPGYRQHLMLATVTGVSPFLSMLRSRPQGAQSRLWLLHGASYRDQFGFDAELAQRAASDPAFDYLPAVSRPEEVRNAGWAGLRGRLDALLPRLLRERGLSPADTAIYACGHPDMVDTVSRQLADSGFSLQTERY
ncbi:FAD-binding oxidoreductase [Alkalilimnicola sp. S0819]|uniref:FAD-binding oxidoreductase n=1 Tax=Alkalilimnicola sp. S0819 TaxID=2613922 RepID=UPI00128B877F|nr:FAD-binding oxidoreductase [Alkalilimnicola sp. S0819]